MLHKQTLQTKGTGQKKHQFPAHTRRAKQSFLKIFTLKGDLSWLKNLFECGQSAQKRATYVRTRTYGRGPAPSARGSPCPEPGRSGSGAPLSLQPLIFRTAPVMKMHFRGTSLPPGHRHDTSEFILCTSSVLGFFVSHLCCLLNVYFTAVTNKHCLSLFVPSLRRITDKAFESGRVTLWLANPKYQSDEPALKLRYLYWFYAV